MSKISHIEYENNGTNSKDEIRKDDLTRVQNYYLQKENFHQIDKNSLIAGHEVHFSIFIHKDLDFLTVIQASDKSPAKISSEVLGMKGDIVIKASDVPLYNKYLEFLEETYSSDKNKEKLKTVLIKEKSKLIMRDVLSDPRSGDNIKKSSTAVEKIAGSIFDNKDTLYDLLSIRNYDYYTYTHSVNVAVLSIGLGIASGLPSSKTFNLGFGAMLHDIGKSAISPEILNKQGRLTAIEYKIMKNHVLEGERILRKHECFPESSFPAVTQHHEKLSGNGYPFGIKASEIKLFGKITAIADCYDALTTQRPYKDTFTPFNALSIIVKETEDYDNELLKLFIKMLGRIY